MKRYKLAIDFDCRDMEAVARPSIEGEYVRHADAQAQIDLLRTALGDVLNYTSHCGCSPIGSKFAHCIARAALEATKP